MIRDVEVWIDADIVVSARVGTLHDDRRQIRFRYDPSWLAHPQAFEIDPTLTLGAAPFFPNADTGNFGVFLDSSPDRWGQTLMQRRESLAARDAKRRPRALHAWDYLLGVQDATRQGALRFRDPASGRFIADEALAAPPVTSLGGLESVARELTDRRIDDLDRLRRWLSVLVAPGASLGGARPKANFTDGDGSLWLAKFPACDDDRDTGAWEYLAHVLGRRAGIDLAPARLVKRSDFHTFCARRFDRSGDRRVFYASAMTMLGRESRARTRRHRLHGGRVVQGLCSITARARPSDRLGPGTPSSSRRRAAGPHFNRCGRWQDVRRRRIRSAVREIRRPTAPPPG